MKLKQLFAACCAGAVLAGALTGCGGPGTDFDGTNKSSGHSNTLKLYLPGEYISDSVISDFEDEYGCHVIVENFDSNEMMYTKVSSGDSYDVLIPSDYMIERLMKEKRLQKIDRSAITNFDHLDPACVGMDFDPNNDYSIPYFWGTVGLVYNKNNVSKQDLEKEGWNILLDQKYNNRIYIYDSERDSFMMAFKALGYSMNTNDEKEIDAAYKWLCKVNNTMRPVYVTDEIIDNMVNGVKDIGQVYSGDAAYILSENPDMGYYCPKQGTNIWSDAMVIPKNAANPELAHKFINYMISYDPAYTNAEEYGYTSPNLEVSRDLTAEGGLFCGNEAYTQRTGYDKDEIFHDNEFLRQRLSELWIKVKAGGDGS